MMEQLLTFSEDVLAERAGARASDFSGIDELVARLDESKPARKDLDDLLEILGKAASKGGNLLHPGFLGFIPNAGAPISAVADYLAALLNRYVGRSGASPAMAQLEWNALRWVARIFGYPEQARGVFTSGGSLANFTAIVTARRARLGSGYAQGQAFMTDQTHHSNERSLRIAGFRPDNIVTLPTDRNLRLDVAALDDALGRNAIGSDPPFLVIANAGTTNTGAVDPIAEIVEIAHKYGVWVHVDGAYGGAFVLTDQGRRMLTGIDQADSITFDPHKGFFLSIGIGCVLVRDGGAMRAAHAAEAAYLQRTDETSSLPDFADYSLELTRPFRGLRLWLALKLYGWEPFTEALELNRSLAVQLHQELCEDPRFEVPWEPDLSTLAFRLRDRDNSDTLGLVRAINERGRVLLSSTTIEGLAYIRACFLSHRSSERTLADLLADIRECLPPRLGSPQ